MEATIKNPWELISETRQYSLMAQQVVTGESFNYIIQVLNNKAAVSQTGFIVFSCIIGVKVDILGLLSTG